MNHSRTPKLTTHLRDTTNAPEDTLSPEDAASPSTAEIRATFKHLRTLVRSEVFVLKMALCAFITVGGIALALQGDWWWRILGIVIIGLMYAHAACLQHQALHNVGFRNQRANTISGIILGLPMLISFAAYRASHLRHHRDLGTPMNQEFFNYGDQYGAGDRQSKIGNLLSWLLRFSMLYHYRLLAVNMGRTLSGARFEGETVTTSRRIRRDHFIILAALVALTVVSVALGSAIIVWLWLLPLVVVAAPAYAAIELPEHFRCETLDQSIFANTRTIRSNRLMAWFTNGNNFHVEHHLMPNLPVERLPDLHAEISSQIRYLHPTYIAYFRSLMQK